MSKSSLTSLFVSQKEPSSSMSEGAHSHWEPNTDVYAAADGVVIKMELAGISKEHLDITVDGQLLTISGERPDECRKGNCSFQVMEIHYGHFERTVELPERCDLSKAKALYQNGFLRIDVPYQSKSPRKRRIQIS